jgi:hypothetical protein
LEAAWVKPVDVVDDDFDDVSDLRASIAADAAPKAGNMTNSDNAAPRGPRFCGVTEQAPCHDEKPNKTGLFSISMELPPRQLMPERGRFFRPQESFAAALPQRLPHVTRAIPLL